MLRADFIPPSDPSLEGMGVPAWFSAVLVLFVVVFLVVAGFVVFVAVRKYRVVKDAGHDPLTLDAALAVKVLDSDALGGRARADDAAPRTVEQRLAEVDALHRRGIISDAEHSAARAAILAG